MLKIKLASDMAGRALINEVMKTDSSKDGCLDQSRDYHLLNKDPT
jgi:hypothetical protein